MDNRSHDERMTTEYSQSFQSIDDILAEYLADEPAPPTAGEGVFQPPEPEALSSIAQMEAEARRIAVEAARQRREEQSQGPLYTGFDGSEVGTEPEEDYSAPADAYRRLERDDYDDYGDDAPPPPEKKKRSLFGRRSKEKPRPEPESDSAYDDGDDYSMSFRDYNGDGSEYAPDEDYDLPDQPEVMPPTFRDYLLSIVAGAFYKLRGSGGNGGGRTMDDEDEDLGKELPAAAASKYYGSHVHSLRLRFRIGLGVWALMAYLSLGLPVPGMLQCLPVAAVMCLAMQLTIMLLALDVVTAGMMKAFRLRAGADSLAVISCIFTILDGVLVLTDNCSPHMPLFVLSSLSLLGVLFSSLLYARALRKSLRVPAIGKRAYSVTGEVGVTGGDITLLKSVRPTVGFVRRSEEAGPDEELFAKAAPFILLLCLLLSLILALVKSDFYDLMYILSALAAPAAPVGSLLVFALPFFLGSMRIFSSGAAIAGWSGMCDVGQSKNLIVTDRDIFPDGSVEIESIRIFADEDAETVMAFAGTMITASGSSISACFADLMEKNGCTMRQVIDFEYLAGGGMKGVIDGHVVICGSSDLMRLMNVRVPFRLLSKTSVLLAIDGVLYGIFALKYTALPLVRQALRDLMRSNRHPVFAIRDFNVTPEMLHDCFDLSTDGYDFPPYIERFEISEAKPSKESKIAAVICREGLGPLVNMADTGRSIYVSTRLNLLLTVLSAVIGTVAVFVKLLLTGSVELSFILIFMAAWLIPVVLSSYFLKG